MKTLPSSAKTRLLGLTWLLAASAPLAAQTADTPATPPPAQPANLSEDDIVQLSEFRVVASDSEGYQAANALSGTRFNTALRDLPKAIDVITEAFIQDIGATDMYEALRFSAGVESNSAPGIDDITGNNFVLRGISAQTTTYRNGYRTFGRTDPIMIQRIEIIRGPSSVFSGPIEPGGTINIITKRPTRNPTAVVRARYGDFDRFRSELILNTPIGEDKRAAVRVGFAVEDYGSPFEFAGHQKTVLGIASDLRVTDNSSLSLDFQYLNNDLTPAAPISYLNSSVTNPTIDRFEPNVRREFNRQGPDAYSRVEQYQSNIDYHHTFSDTLSMFVGLSHRVQELERHLVGGSTRITTSTVTGRRTAARVVTYEPGAYSWVVAPQAYLLGKFNYLGLEHSSIIGVEYSKGGSRNDVYRANRPGVNVDLFVPSEYDLGDTSDPSVYLLNESRRTEDELTGFSMNNTWKFWNGRAQVLQGFRWGEVSGSRLRLDFAESNPSRYVESSTSGTSHSFGISARVLPALSLFASYSESFVPQSIAANTSYDKDGNFLPPVTGEGWDVGLKWELQDGKISGNLVAFGIRRANAPTPDEDFPGFFVAEAESVARGYEATINGRLTKNLQIVSSYAYIEAFIVEDSRPERIGWRSTNVPRHQGTMWLNYSVPAVKGLKVSLGVIGKSRRRGNNTLADLPGIQLPGYVRYDGRINYNTTIFGRRTAFTLSGQNLTNKDYKFSANGYGEERSLFGQVSVTF